MKFDKAYELLLKGKRIYRQSCVEKGSLAGTVERVYGSFYLTIYDILADDWASCEVDEIFDKNVYDV